MSLENNSGSFKSFNQNYSFQPSSGGTLSNSGAETLSNIGNNVSNSGESNKIPYTPTLQTEGYKNPRDSFDYNPLRTGGMLHPSELQTPGLPSDGNQTTSSDDH